MVRRNVLIFAISLITQCAEAQTPANGFYRISPSGVPARAPDRTEILLGNKLEISIRQVTIESGNNENSVFSLTLWTSVDNSWVEYRSIALWVDGFGVRFNSGGSSGLLGATLGSYGTEVVLPANPEAVQAVARFFGVKPRLRVKPPYTLAVDFVPAKASFNSAEPVIVTLWIENTGSDAVAFKVGGSNRGPRDNQFSFTAYCPDGSLCDEINAADSGGVAYWQPLQPGAVFNREVDLRRWFNFSQPGLYKITGSYGLRFLQSTLPPDHPEMPDLFCIWSDKAMASFEVRIR